MSFNNNDENNNKGLLTAIGLFVLFMIGYNYFFEKPVEKQQAQQSFEESESLQEDNLSDEKAIKITVEEALKKSSRESFENSKIKGSVDLEGGVIDSLTLKEYKQTTKQDSKEVNLLAPRGTDHEFFYLISYKNKKGGEKIIDEKTVWTKGDNFSSSQALLLKAESEEGIVVEREIILDEGYLITVRDKLINTTNQEKSLQLSADLIRSAPKTHNYAVAHEGLVGLDALQGKISEKKYDDIKEPTSMGNSQWLGFTDMYWLVSIINKSKNLRLSYFKIGENAFKCSAERKEPIVLNPNSVVELKYSMFAGPKEMKLLKNYERELGIEKFDMAIDFGWFFMLTKPLLALLGLMGQLFHNMGLVILVLTLMFKIATYPLMKKSLRSAARMREVQPKIANLQKLYAHDKQRMNQELMALYKKEQISPLSGCLPMLLQAPIFFCLYKVFFISIEMRHAPLFGWIHDLSAPDQLYLVNLFGFIDWTPPKFLQIGLWPLIMGLSMFFQQKITSLKNNKVQAAEKTPEAKMQENMMLILPLVFTYVCSSFPVGVVVYWTISNIIGIGQQYYINQHFRKKA